MALIPLRPILDATDRLGYAQGAFNVNAVCQAEAVIDIHSALRSPAIIQVADPANGFLGGRVDFFNSTLEEKARGAKNIASAVSVLAAKADIPIALHLDHGRTFESVKAAIDGGFTSVMIDGSSLDYDDNVELTREVVKYAKARGVTVEAELGVLSGVEDDVFSETSSYTNPLQAVDFFRKTRVDALAISFGTMHGANKGANVKIRKEIAIAIKECLRHEHIQGVLVSHGSSTVPRYIVDELNSLGADIKNANGIPLDQLVELGMLGIGKINVDTDIRLAVTRNIREFFIDNPSMQSNPDISEIWHLMDSQKNVLDPRCYLTPIMSTLIYGEIPNEGVYIITELIKKGVMEVVGTLIVEFNAVGKAPHVKQKSLLEMADFYKKEGF